jgi:hypothetical protein
MNINECEEIYGKLLKEDENFYYFLGKGQYGITIPKHAYWTFQPERLNPEDAMSVCDSPNTTNK